GMRLHDGRAVCWGGRRSPEETCADPPCPQLDDVRDRILALVGRGVATAIHPGDVRPRNRDLQDLGEPGLTLDDGLHQAELLSNMVKKWSQNSLSSAGRFTRTGWTTRATSRMSGRSSPALRSPNCGRSPACMIKPWSNGGTFIAVVRAICSPTLAPRPSEAPVSFFRIIVH